MLGSVFWAATCARLNVNTLDEQERYFTFLKSQCQMGNCTRFKREKDSYWFPNPVRKQRYPTRTKLSGGKEWTFPAGLRFPQMTVQQEEQNLSQLSSENAEINERLLTLEVDTIQSNEWMHWKCWQLQQLEDDLTEGPEPKWYEKAMPAPDDTLAPVPDG